MTVNQKWRCGTTNYRSKKPCTFRQWCGNMDRGEGCLILVRCVNTERLADWLTTHLELSCNFYRSVLGTCKRTPNEVITGDLVVVFHASCLHGLASKQHRQAVIGRHQPMQIGHKTLVMSACLAACCVFTECNESLLCDL